MAAKKEDLEKKEKDMAAREEALNAKDKTLSEKADQLTAWAEKLEKREAEVAERERMVMEPAVLETTEEPDVPRLSESDCALIDAGCKAYGIAPDHVIGTNVDRDTGEAVIVTNGGKKVRFAAGQKDSEPLSEIEITGINPKAKKRKPIAGKAR